MIKLNDDEIQILGTPCFVSARMANLLIGAGIYEDKVKKAEYEQAVFAHWGLDLYKKYGKDWKKEGEKILKECSDKIKAKTDINNDILKEFYDLLQKEANVKINKAMQLFIKVDDVYRRVFFHATGFTDELTAKNLREHFNTLELMDMIDDVIFNFEDELKNN